MAKKPNDDLDPDRDDDAAEKRLAPPKDVGPHSADRPRTPPGAEVKMDPVRALITGDNRRETREVHVPPGQTTGELPFRANIEGLWFEHVSEAEDGTWIYAPTR